MKRRCQRMKEFLEAAAALSKLLFLCPQQVGLALKPFQAVAQLVALLDARFELFAESELLLGGELRLFEY